MESTRQASNPRDVLARIGIVEHSDLGLAVVYSADGRVVISGEKDESVRIWEAFTVAPIAAYDWEVAITPTGTLAATGCKSNSVVFWDVEGLNRQTSATAPTRPACRR